jgi:type III restriction enzyme
VASTFYEHPVLNSPYAKPRFHHPLDEHGQPLGRPPVEGRRPSKFIVPVPRARRRGAATQGTLDLETYTDNAIINEIRCLARPSGRSGLGRHADDTASA